MDWPSGNIEKSGARCKVVDGLNQTQQAVICGRPATLTSVRLTGKARCAEHETDYYEAAMK